MAKAKPKPPAEDEAVAEAAEDEGDVVNKPTSINVNLDPDKLHLHDSRSE